MAHIVSVADVSDFKSAQRAKMFFEREEVRNRLARMKAVCQRVDHGNSRVLCELFENRLFEKPRDDSIRPAFETPRHISNGFAFAEVRRSVIEERGRTAQARDSDFERHARPQRWLLENQSKESSGKRAAITIRASFHVRRELQHVANLRGAPLHS